MRLLGPLAAAFLLAGCSAGIPPTISVPNLDAMAEPSKEGLVVTLLGVEEGLTWEELAVSSRCRAPSGPVLVGQQVQCPGRGGMRIVHCATGKALFATDGDGSGEQGAADCGSKPGPLTEEVLQEWRESVQAGGNVTLDLGEGVRATLLASEDCVLEGTSRVANRPPAHTTEVSAAVTYVSIEHDGSWSACLVAVRFVAQQPPQREEGLGILFWTGAAWADVARDPDAEGVVRATDAEQDLPVFMVRTTAGTIEAVVGHASDFVIVQRPDLPLQSTVLPGSTPTLPPSNEQGRALIPGVDGTVCRTVDGLIGTVEGASCVIPCVLPDGAKGRLIDGVCLLALTRPPWGLIIAGLVITGLVVVALVVWRVVRRRRRNGTGPGAPQP